MPRDTDEPEWERTKRRTQKFGEHSGPPGSRKPRRSEGLRDFYKLARDTDDPPPPLHSG